MLPTHRLLVARIGRAGTAMILVGGAVGGLRIEGWFRAVVGCRDKLIWDTHRRSVVRSGTSRASSARSAEKSKRGSLSIGGVQLTGED